MHSIKPPDATDYAPGPSLPLPWVQGTVPAGFPSPAADFAVKRHDLNELLITHLAATFMWQARGLSMIDLGVADGDVLVVTRESVRGAKAGLSGQRRQLRIVYFIRPDALTRRTLTVSTVVNRCCSGHSRRRVVAFAPGWRVAMTLVGLVQPG